MKYLIINGSPHKGNTWQLVETTRLQLEQCDDKAEFQEINLSELQLPFCIGCSNCFRLGYEQCPHYEKIFSVVSAMEQADGVIITSSVFNTRETAMLKNFFDHLCFMLHRPHFFMSKAFVLTTTGGVGGKTTAKSICSTLRGIGFNRCYYFTSASFSWNAYKPKTATINKLQKSVSKFYHDIASKKQHYPSTSVLIPYNLFRGMCPTYAPGTEFETEDGIYWTDPVRNRRVYDSTVPVFVLQKPVGHLFYIIGKYAGKIKSMQVTYRK